MPLDLFFAGAIVWTMNLPAVLSRFGFTPIVFVRSWLLSHCALGLSSTALLVAIPES